FDGTANDSSLANLEGTTDAEGNGRVLLQAGAIASAFRVRISAEDAAPIFVNVGVSDRGFGRLQVEATYEGEREGRLGARVYVGDDCSEQAGDGRFRELSEGDGEFVGIPAGTSLAVIATLESEAVLARGCVDGIELVADEVTTVQVTLEDAAVDAVGVYDTTLRVRSPEVGNALRDLDRVEDATTTAVLLDGIAAALSAMPDQLREFSEARDDTLEARVAGILDERGLGFDALWQRVLDTSADAVGNVTLESELRVGPRSTLATQSLRVGEEERLITSTLTAPTALEGEQVGDVFEAESLSIELSAGDLALALLQETAVLAGFESYDTWLVEPNACEGLELPACDDACSAIACTALATYVVASIEASLGELDDQFPAIELAGEVALEDLTGDLAADQAEGSFEGTWGSAAAEAELEGDRRTLR
ncbi:MAG: hypothetical protein AAF411_22700, partial [Myxococcota bacterium]